MEVRVGFEPTALGICSPLHWATLPPHCNKLRTKMYRVSCKIAYQMRYILLGVICYGIHFDLVRLLQRRLDSPIGTACGHCGCVPATQCRTQLPRHSSDSIRHLSSSQLIIQNNIRNPPNRGHWNSLGLECGSVFLIRGC